MLTSLSEAIEDLTGGVTTEILTSDILDVNRFWTDELLHVNSRFIIGCATGRFDEWQGDVNGERKDIQLKRAFTVIEACEVTHDGRMYRLLNLRNPWGKTEWSGAWSHGSVE